SFGASPLAPAAREGRRGGRLATFVADALRIERAEGRMQKNCPGVVIGWSLGASGAWTLAAKPVDAGLKAAAMFYPALLRPQSYQNTVPILVLQGTADDLNPETELRDFIAHREAGTAPGEIVALPGAGNAFDVPSLVPARTLRYPALTGVPHTFAYNAEAARNANQALETFLRKQGIAAGRCAGK